MVGQPRSKVNQSTSWKILIIDDDEDDYLIAQNMLKEAKGRRFELRWAKTYADGRAELLLAPYNAVLVDYDLGPHSGVELIREANARGYPAPLILFTGRGNYEVDVEAMAAGATLYLSKGEANPLLLERSIRYAIELKQKERELRFSEERFQSAFNASPNAQVISRMEDGYIEVINDSFEQLFGYARDEVVGKTSLELNMFANAADRAEAVRRLRADKHLRNFETAIRIKSGAIRQACLSVELMTMGPENLMLTVIEDITERKQVEARLAYQAMLLENVHDAVVATDTNRIITAWNQAAERLYGWSAAEAIGRPVGEMIPSEWTAEQSQAAMRDLLENKGFTGSMAQYASDGKKMWVECHGSALLDASGQVNGLVSANRDITELKETQEALRKALEKATWLARFPDENPNPVARVGTDGRILYCNPTSAGLPGWKCQVGQPLVEPLRRLVEQAMTRKQEVRENARLAGRFYAISVLPIQEASYANLYGIDITEQETANQARRISEDRYQRLFDAIDQGFCIIEVLFDDTQKAVDYRFLEVNPAFARQTGINDAVGRWMREIAPAHEAFWFEVYGEVARSGVPRRFEHQAAQLHHYYDVFAFRVGAPEERKVAVLFNDISERKQVERSLRESQERLERAQQIAHLGSWELDVVNNRLTWSDEVYRIFGLRPQEFGATYHAFLEHVHPEDRAAVDEAYSSSLREHRDSYEIEHRIVRKSTGEIRFVHEKCEHFRDAAGQVRLSIGMVHDITERKQAEEALLETAHKLERSNRELEQFAFIASHDLQEPLRKIIMFGDRVVKLYGEDTPEEANDYLKRMRSASERMQKMIQGLLELSRVNTRGTQFAPVALARVANDVLSDLEPRIQAAQGRVILEDLPVIEADELQMRQLFLNLLGNAIKFHKPGEPPLVRIRSLQTGELNPYMVEIRVEDHGIGFEQQYAERIFEPFQRLHDRNQYEGTGLGLSICQKIIERHNGTIQVESAPGIGTTFTVRLPMKQP